MLGQRINNFEIRAVLGEGGMGTVYRADHPFSGRQVAIKVLRRSLIEDATLVARFMNEARAANAIRHPNIIDIIDVGTLPDGLPYLMMELLEGESLADRLERVGRLHLADALAIARDAGDAIAAAHEKGIVHRDLKPGIIFLANDPGTPRGWRTKVLDFGIAKLGANVAPGMQTNTGAIMGTPTYMSPEQCRGSGVVDHRSDIYALAVILYEMLRGQPPFVEAGGGDYRAMSLNSTTGAGVGGGSGDVPFSETLSAMGKTLGVACGVSSEVLDLNIRGGKVVAGALAG